LKHRCADQWKFSFGMADPLLGWLTRFGMADPIWKRDFPLVMAKSGSA